MTMTFTRKTCTQLFLAAVALAGWSSAQAATSPAIASVQARLQVLSTAGVPDKNYNYAKAQCWADAATTAWSENDRTGFAEGALNEAQRVTAALEGNKLARPVDDTPLIAGSDKVREDLWAQLAGLKNHAQFACAAKSVACAEVRLVRAGHANQQTGWRQASPHIVLAEYAIKTAQAEIAACAPPPAAAVPVAQVAPQPVPEKIDLPAAALFKFDHSDLAHVLPAEKRKLDELVLRLKSWKKIETLSIKGYADRLGSNAYNDKLSLARAQTIAAYFAKQGIVADKVNVSGMDHTAKDAATTLTQCPAKLPARKLIQCLQPDRRIALEVTGLKE